MKKTSVVLCIGVLAVVLSACSKNPAGPATLAATNFTTQGWIEGYIFEKKLTGFSQPAGVTFSQDGTMYVADNGTHVVKKFRPDGTLLAAFGQNWLHSAFSVAVDDASNLVFVTDNFRNCIQVFNQQGVHVKAWTGFKNPHGILAYNGGIYVCDTNANVIKRFNPLAPNGSAPMFISTLYSKLGNMAVNQPMALAADAANGILYLTDGNHRVLKFREADRQLLLRWGSQGSGNYQFNDPDGVAVNPPAADRVAVVDRANSCVKVYDNSGKFISAFGKYGSGMAQFKFYEWVSRPNAAGIAMDPAGKIYVADPGNNCVQIFTKLLVPTLD